MSKHKETEFKAIEIDEVYIIFMIFREPIY